MLLFPILHTEFDQGKFYRILFRNKSKLEYLILYDSGATIPVWVNKLDMLLYEYPDAKLLNYMVLLEGFSNARSFCPVYEIPEFKLSDGEHSLIYEKLPVAVTQLSASVDRPYSFIAIYSAKE